MAAIRGAGLTLGVDPLGGAARPYWEPINSVYKLDIAVVNPVIDPTFSFMTVDHDGKIRMDPSSPYAMARLVDLKDRFRVAFANDCDADRHGIVTRSAGLMNPNHYLAVAIRYLLTHRPRWPAHAAVGKTLVSSSMIDRVVEHLGRRLSEVPVGFKWFVPGLFDGSYCFGGEESAGASFLRHDGTVWTTDKDGLIMDLLAAEITARTGKDPGEHYRELTAEFGTPYYTRIDAPATPEQKARLAKLSPEAVQRIDTRRRADHRQADPRPGQWRPDRRPEGRGSTRLVRGPALGHGEHLQDLRRELRRPVTPGRHRGRGSRHRRQCHGMPRMSDRGASVPPFPPGYRASGVLLHVTSLPSAYGIGDLGPAAFAWLDRLHEAGQRWWQALPLGPTGYGDSPYQCLSSFAGNELLISPDGLIDDGLLQAVDCAGQAFSPSAVEYEKVVPFKLRVLETAWSRFSAGARPDLRPAYEQFCEDHGFWLDDYALFRALKARYNGACYLDWPVELVRRTPAALARGAARAGEPDRARSLCSIPALSPGGTSRATRA